MYLTYGVTGLLFMIMNEGYKIGRGLQLNNPLAAMRAFSLDPWLRTKVPLANGKSATAIDIQRAYLREARQHVDSGRFPDWTYHELGGLFDQLAAAGRSTPSWSRRKKSSARSTPRPQADALNPFG